MNGFLQLAIQLLSTYIGCVIVASLAKKINRLNERCLRIIYCDKKSSFEELLEKDSSVSIHERGIQILATEMYKICKGMFPPQITQLFAQRNEHPYN